MLHTYDTGTNRYRHEGSTHEIIAGITQIFEKSMYTQEIMHASHVNHTT